MAARFEFEEKKEYDYRELGMNEEFHEFIIDIITRMGLSSEDINKLFHKDIKIANMNEFAKCFVTRAANKHYNYEIYELTGDSCLNNSVVMYFYTQLQSTIERKKIQNPRFVPDVRLVDYFNKLKAFYISTKEYADIANRLGFNEFLKKGKRDVHSENDKFLEDSIEAFIGCFEVLVDRCIQPYYAHQFVSNFVKYIFSSRHINYHPSILYDSITLLKETNDQLKLFGYQYIIKTDANSQELKAIRQDTNPAKTTDINIPSIPNNKSKQNQLEMSSRILDYLKNNYLRLNIRQELIKNHPTPEELGIEELCL